jgi:uncharacterized protein (TIRG00374 family)|tara:strand:+ start:4453 stop:5391 length:939 start_codon:yes stop_codon:yes gene_type:complete
MKFDKKYLLAIVGVVALYAIFLIISDLQIVLDKIQNFNTDYLPIILSIVILSWLIVFLRWRILLQNFDIHIPVKDSILIFLSGFAMEITPGKVGQLLKSQLLKEKFDIPRKNTIPVIILEQLYSAVGLVIVGIFGIWFFDLGIYILIIAIILLVFIFSLISSKQFFNKVNNFRFISRFGITSDSHEDLKSSVRGKIFVYASSLSALFWFLECAVVYYVLLSFEITSLNFLSVLSIYTSSIILGVVSFLPLGIGVVESSLAGFLALEGIDISISLTVVILIRIFTRWIGVSVGFVSLKFVGVFSFRNKNSALK